MQATQVRSVRSVGSPADAQDLRERLEFMTSCLPGLAYERRLNHDGTVSYPYFGGTLLKCFGLTAEMVLADPTLLFERIHPSDREKFTATVAQAASSRTGYALDLRWIDNAGQIVWTRYLAVAKEHPEGVRWMCLSVDVTELKEAREAFKTANSERSDFLATMSHEVRAPLHSILGYNELLSGTELSPDQRRFTDLGTEASRSLLTIVNEALEYAEVDRDKRAEVPDPFDLPGRLKSLYESFEPEAAKKGLNFVLSLDPRLPKTVLGNPQRLGQVLTNVVSNAIKYTDIGTVELSCQKIGGGQFGTRIRIEVRDTGIGIPKDLVPHLFGRFVQASRHQARRMGGSGLGLSIARALVGQMGGTITLETQENVGTVVRIELAFRPAATAEVHPFRTPETKAGSERPKRVLVVDDMPANIELVRDFLRGAPVTVTTASSGEEALEMVISESMDLVFMDLNMPVMSGFETTRLIRALDGGKGAVPIVALTGEASTKAREHCRSTGFSDFVAKPFRRADLTEMIAKWS